MQYDKAKINLNSTIICYEQLNISRILEVNSKYVEFINFDFKSDEHRYIFYKILYYTTVLTRNINI